MMPLIKHNAAEFENGPRSASSSCRRRRNTAEVVEPDWPVNWFTVRTNSDQAGCLHPDRQFGFDSFWADAVALLVGMEPPFATPLRDMSSMVHPRPLAGLLY